MITERRKVEYVTKVVGNSGGLGTMFFGLVIAIFAITGYLSDLDAQTRNYYGKDLTVSSILLLVIALFWIFAVPKIRVYLREKYGQVQKESYGWKASFADLLYIAPYLLAHLIGVCLDVHFDLPFSATVLLTAIFIFGLWWANQRGVSNLLLWLTAVCLILSFAPWKMIYLQVTVLNDEAAQSAFYRFVCSMIFGVVYFLLGLFDYRLMTATLVPVTRSEEEIYESV